jgi:Domain of unknown function (DUF4265)
MNSSQAKILFYGDSEDAFVESVWATRQGDYYQLDNIPFYARGFAWLDIVRVEVEADGALRCNGLVTASGNSTIRLWFSSANEVSRVRSELKAMGCDSELNADRLVAVNVPSTSPYFAVKSYFDEGEQLNIFEYEEGCLAQ